LFFFHFGLVQTQCQTTNSSLVEGRLRASIVAREDGGIRAYELTSNAELRDDNPPDKRIAFSETSGHARIRTGNLMF